MPKKVKDYMSKDVIHFTEETSMFDAIKTLCEKHISGAPVLDKSRNVIGIVTATDITKALDVAIPSVSFPMPSTLGIIYGLLKARKGRKDFTKSLDVSTANKVHNVMMRNVVTIDLEESIYEAATIMNRHKINRMPVVKEEKLVGIISREDLIKCLVED